MSQHAGQASAKNRNAASTQGTSISDSRVPLLSCARCKSKKLRCSREEPTCARCKENDAECVYPERKPKPKGSRSRAAIIEDILSRLSHVENRLGITNTSSGGRNPNRDSQMMCQSLENQDESPDEGDTSDSSDEGDDRIASLEQLIADATTETLQLLNDPAADMPADKHAALSPLSEALTSIRNVRLKPEKKVEQTEDVYIQPELARRWVENIYTHSTYENFFNLVDKKLLLALPDIIHTPGLTLDYSIMIVYYNALFIGWADEASSMTEEYVHIGKDLYRQCLKLLPAWKKDGKLEVSDVVGLTLLTWMAVENFDYHLAYKFHAATCEVTMAMGLHHLDHPSETPLVLKLIPKHRDTEEYKDGLRRIFWRIIHTEYFFRLYYNHPALISKVNFAVNFPQVGEVDYAGASVDAIVFIINCRFALIVREFFELLDTNDPERPVREEYISQVQTKVEELLAEWKVEEWFRRSKADSPDRWLYADTLINGSLIIVLTERMTAIRHGYRGRLSERAVAATRRAMETMLESNHSTESEKTPNSYNFISVYPFVTFFTLYQHILHQLYKSPRQAPQSNISSIETSSTLTSVQADMELMEKMTWTLEKMARTQEEIGPVVTALKALNQVSRSTLQHRSNTSSPVLALGRVHTRGDGENDDQTMAKDAGSRWPKRARRSLETSGEKSRTASNPEQDIQSGLLQSHQGIPNTKTQQQRRHAHPRFDFSYIPSQSFDNQTQFLHPTGSVELGHSGRTGSQSNSSEMRGDSVSNSVSPPEEQLQPQLLQYIDTIENDLFGRNWHENWWTE